MPPVARTAAGCLSTTPTTPPPPLVSAAHGIFPVAPDPFFKPLVEMFSPLLPRSFLHSVAAQVVMETQNAVPRAAAASRKKPAALNPAPQRTAVLRLSPVRRASRPRPARQQQPRRWVEGAGQWPRHCLFSNLTCAQLFDPSLKHKIRFLASERVYSGVSHYCMLCEEPVPAVAAHCDLWDHMTRYVGVRLTANYMAHWGRVGQASPRAAAAVAPAPPMKGRPTKGTPPQLRNETLTNEAEQQQQQQQQYEGSFPVPRWSAAAVVQDAAQTLPRHLFAVARPHPFVRHPIRDTAAAAATGTAPLLVSSSRGRSRSARADTDRPVYCLVHERDDVLRQAQLAAILQVLQITPRCLPDTAPLQAQESEKRWNTTSRGAAAAATATATTAAASASSKKANRSILHHSLLLTRQTYPMANLGERTFRSLVGRCVAQLLPPMGPEATTRVQQRCWGRRNLEILFDRLHMDRLQASAGSPRIAVSKNDKGSVMRQVVQELVLVQRELEREAGKKSACAGAEASGAPFVDPRYDVHVLLVEEALQRLAFELVYTQTADFMQHAWRPYVLMGYPSERDMEESGYF